MRSPVAAVRERDRSSKRHQVKHRRQLRELQLTPSLPIRWSAISRNCSSFPTDRANSDRRASICGRGCTLKSRLFAARIRSGSRHSPRSRRSVITRFVPWVGKAFGLCAGRRGLAFLEIVEGAAAPTGVIDALDTYWILGCYLGRSRAQHAKPTYGK